MNKKDQVIKGFWELFRKKIWLDEFKMKESLKGYTPSEVHCIEYIGENEDSNVTKLADSFYMTRSAISKMTKKLMEKNLIENYKKPTNKKEIYFRLTTQGKEIYKIHDELHKEFKSRDKAVFDSVSEKELDIMINFAERYNDHLDAEINKLGVDVTTETSDRL